MIGYAERDCLLGNAFAECVVKDVNPACPCGVLDDFLSAGKEPLLHLEHIKAVRHSFLCSSFQALLVAQKL